VVGANVGSHRGDIVIDSYFFLEQTERGFIEDWTMLKQECSFVQEIASWTWAKRWFERCMQNGQ
jgi:hypothetical protein